MTTTKNGLTAAEEAIAREGYCIVGCGWDEVPKHEHGPYCERMVGSSASGATEPGGIATQFWSQVISPFMHGWFTPSQAMEQEQHRDGVQLTVSVRGEIPATTDEGGGWRGLKFNVTAGEARSLAAQLVAAADSHDGINGHHRVMHRLERIAEHVGAEIWGTR
jgi:hypothetical protein